MGGTLYEILAWARSHGEVKAVQRLQLKLLPLTVREGIVFDKVGPRTQCSAEYLKAAREAAAQIVGKPCPIK